MSRTALFVSLMVATAAAQESLAAPGFEYVGCVEANPAGFGVPVDFFKPFTASECQIACAGKSSYAALNGGCQCSALDSPAPTFTQVDEAKCDKPCIADDAAQGQCGSTVTSKTTNQLYNLYKVVADAIPAATVRDDDCEDDDDDDDMVVGLKVPLAAATTETCLPEETNCPAATTVLPACPKLCTPPCPPEGCPPCPEGGCPPPCPANCSVPASTTVAIAAAATLCATDAAGAAVPLGATDATGVPCLKECPANCTSCPAEGCPASCPAGCPSVTKVPVLATGVSLISTSPPRTIVSAATRAAVVGSTLTAVPVAAVPTDSACPVGGCDDSDLSGLDGLDSSSKASPFQPTGFVVSPPDAQSTALLVAAGSKFGSMNVFGSLAAAAAVILVGGLL